MTNRVRTDLAAQFLTQLPDNSTQNITATKLRTACTDLNDTIFRSDAIALSDSTGRILLGQGNYLLRDFTPRIPSIWDNLIGAWELDGNDATSLLDASTAGLDLTDAGTPVPTQVTAKLGDFARGTNGTGSQYIATDSVFGVAHSFTMLGWYNPYGGANGGICGIENNGGVSTYAITYHHNGFGRLYINWIDAASAGQSIYVASSTSNLWQFYAITFDNATGTMSVSRNDGTPTTLVSSMTWNSNMTFKLFSAGFGNGYCRVDAVRYFNSVLSSADITAHYNAGAGLVYPT